MDRLAYAHEIALRPDAAVLRLSNAHEIDEFTREYLAPYSYGLPFASTPFIDWPAVAERYDGIVISPYVWPRRLDGGASWDYAWECASGCIWRARAIERVTLLNEAPAVAETAEKER